MADETSDNAANRLRRLARHYANSMRVMRRFYQNAAHIEHLSNFFSRQINNGVLPPNRMSFSERKAANEFPSQTQALNSGVLSSYRRNRYRVERLVNSSALRNYLGNNNTADSANRILSEYRHDNNYIPEYHRYIRGNSVGLDLRNRGVQINNALLNAGALRANPRLHSHGNTINTGRLQTQFLHSSDPLTSYRAFQRLMGDNNVTPRQYVASRYYSRMNNNRINPTDAGLSNAVRYYQQAQTGHQQKAGSLIRNMSGVTGTFGRYRGGQFSATRLRGVLDRFRNNYTGSRSYIANNTRRYRTLRGLQSSLARIMRQAVKEAGISGNRNVISHRNSFSLTHQGSSILRHEYQVASRNHKRGTDTSHDRQIRRAYNSYNSAAQAASSLAHNLSSLRGYISGVQHSLNRMGAAATRFTGSNSQQLMNRQASMPNTTHSELAALLNPDLTYVRAAPTTPLGRWQAFGGGLGLSTLGAYGIANQNMAGNQLRLNEEQNINNGTLGSAINGYSAPYHTDDRIQRALNNYGRWRGENSEDMAQFYGALGGTHTTNPYQQERTAQNEASFARNNNVNPQDTAQLFSTLAQAGGLGQGGQSSINSLDFSREFAGMLRNDHLGGMANQQAQGLQSIFGNMLNSGQTVTPQNARDILGLQSQLSSGRNGQVFQGQQGANELNRFSSGVGSQFSSMFVRNAFAGNDPRYGGQQGLYRLQMDMQEPLKHLPQTVGMIRNMSNSGLGPAGTEDMLATQMGLGPEAAKKLYSEAMSGNLNPASIRHAENNDQSTGAATQRHARRAYRAQGNSTLDIKVAMDQRGRINTSSAFDTARRGGNHYRNTLSGRFSSLAGGAFHGIGTTLLSGAAIASLVGLFTGNGGSLGRTGIFGSVGRYLTRHPHGKIASAINRSPATRKFGSFLRHHAVNANSVSGGRFNDNYFTNNHFGGSGSFGSNGNGPSGSNGSNSGSSSSGFDRDENYRDRRLHLENERKDAESHGNTDRASRIRSAERDLDHAHLNRINSRPSMLGRFGNTVSRYGRVASHLPLLGHIAPYTSRFGSWLSRRASNSVPLSTRFRSWTAPVRTRISSLRGHIANTQTAVRLRHFQNARRFARNYYRSGRAGSTTNRATSFVARNGRTVGRLSRIARFGGRIIGPIGAGMSAMSDLHGINRHNFMSKGLGLAGDFGGFGAGAAVGTTLFPGIGTIGGALFGGFGSMIGRPLAAGVGRLLQHPINSTASFFRRGTQGFHGIRSTLGAGIAGLFGRRRVNRERRRTYYSLVGINHLLPRLAFKIRGLFGNNGLTGRTTDNSAIGTSDVSAGGQNINPQYSQSTINSGNTSNDDHSTHSDSHDTNYIMTPSTQSQIQAMGARNQSLMPFFSNNVGIENS